MFHFTVRPIFHIACPQAHLPACPTQVMWLEIDVQISSSSLALFFLPFQCLKGQFTPKSKKAYFYVCLPSWMFCCVLQRFGDICSRDVFLLSDTMGPDGTRFAVLKVPKSTFVKLHRNHGPGAQDNPQNLWVVSCKKVSFYHLLPYTHAGWTIPTSSHSQTVKSGSLVMFILDVKGSTVKLALMHYIECSIRLSKQSMLNATIVIIVVCCRFTDKITGLGLGKIKYLLRLGKGYSLG